MADVASGQEGGLDPSTLSAALAHRRECAAQESSEEDEAIGEGKQVAVKEEMGSIRIA